MTRFLLDANIVVYALSGEYPKLRERLADCAPGDAAISFAEIMLGATLGKPPPIHLIEDFIEIVPMLPFDEAAARAYAELPFKRARSGRLLAAHALSLDATIVPNNAADFADISELKIENWTK